MNAAAPAALVDTDALAALEHLLSHVLAGLPLADHIRLAATDDGRSIRYLAMLGIRYCSQHKAIAIACELPADDLFLWTQWHGVHDRALLRVDGARRGTVRIGGIPRQAVLVPIPEGHPIDPG